MTQTLPPTTNPISPRRPHRRKRIIVSAFLLFAFLALNALAFIQSRAMTHFTDGGPRTAPPESLSTLAKLKIIFTGVRIPKPINRTTPQSYHLDFQTLRFGGPTNDDCEAWYIPASIPSNPHGLCLEFHGYGGGKSSLLESAAAFHDLGYDVLAVDFQGYGGSRGHQTTIGYREADDVAAAVRYAARWPTQPLILYGQSMGGAAILRAVAVLKLNPSAVIIESTFDRLRATIANRFTAVGLPAFPLADLLVFWGGLQQGYNGFLHNPADYALQVHCPVLIFQGGHDYRVTNAQAENLFTHLAGPKQFELFPTAGHCAFIANDRARWTSAVVHFLADHTPNNK